MIEITKLQAILQFILKESSEHPDECLHCIVNEALDDFKVPLFVSGDKLTVKPYIEPEDKLTVEPFVYPENCTNCENYVDIFCTIVDKFVGNPNSACPCNSWSSIKCQ